MLFFCFPLFVTVFYKKGGMFSTPFLIAEKIIKRFRSLFSLAWIYLGLPMLYKATTFYTRKHSATTGSTMLGNCFPCFLILETYGVLLLFSFPSWHCLFLLFLYFILALKLIHWLFVHISPYQTISFAKRHFCWIFYYGDTAIFSPGVCKGIISSFSLFEKPQSPD